MLTLALFLAFGFFSSSRLTLPSHGESEWRSEAYEEGEKSRIAGAGRMR